MKIFHANERPEKFVPRCAVDCAVLQFGRNPLVVPVVKLKCELLYSGQRGDKRAADLAYAIDLPVQLSAVHAEAERFDKLSRTVMGRDYKDLIVVEVNCRCGELQCLCNIDEVVQVW